LLKLIQIQQFCTNKTVFILDTGRLALWPHQKLNVVQLQEKQHVHVKEMQQQKLLQEKQLQLDENVVHLQNVVQLVEDQLEEKLLKEDQLEELLKDDLQEEEDDNLLPYFFFKIKIYLSKILGNWFEAKFIKLYKGITIIFK